MTALKTKIVRLIEASGPIGVADYMALCLFDPEHGYYTTREPFGTEGDFTTAPEISQMFGELVAIWLYSAWQACGSPLPATIAEIGPGRGTLMKDMLRTFARIGPHAVRGMRFAMIEASPRLTDVQRRTLADAPARLEWFDHVDRLPNAPLFIVGNELFDALPIRQYIKTATGWRERLIGLDDDDNLTFVAGAGSVQTALLPPDAGAAPEGSTVELAPARSALMETIATRLQQMGGAGLFIDYGYTAPAIGDTLQAILRHAYDDVLAHPGDADLTAHVDFAALAAIVHDSGLGAHVTTQGEFLLAMGLLERAGRLGSGGDSTTQERIRGEVERLAGTDAMGTLFKVLAILPANVTVPPFGNSQ